MKKDTLLIAAIAIISLLFITATLSQSETTAPKITVNPKSMNFGSVAVGSASAPKTVTIKNTRVSDLAISAITITGDAAAEFSQTNDCNTNIPTGSSCTINVTFAPALPFSKKSAIMSIASNDPKKPTVNVKLTGRAPQPKISVAPKSLNFGSVPVGNTPAPKIVTIQNTGISDLAVSSISITGTNESEFSQTNDCSIVSNATSCAITVTYNPAYVGSKNAAMSIASNDPKKPTVTVKLTGKATEGGNQLPTISSLNPNKGTQGQSLNITIAGTHFINAESVSFGSDITVNSFTVDSSTQITANITISLSTATGLRNVSVTTPVGTGTGDGLFEVLAGVAFSFIDEPADIPSGVTGEVDNETHRLRVVGIANPNTSRYVSFTSNPFPLSSLSTAVFETDISLPTGLRTGLLNSDDPLGDGTATFGHKIVSMGTPVLFRIAFRPSYFAEISMLSHYGLALEQVVNNKQLSNEISLNGGLAKTYVPIAKWTGGSVSFDPFGLIDGGSVGARFHARLSVDFEKNKIMAEIIPQNGFEENFNPFPVGTYGAIASTFTAVTNLIDYTKDQPFDGNVFFAIYIRTNGNTEVDDVSAPGGTLRYIDRIFENVKVALNKPIEFPPIPPFLLPSDNFDDGIVAPFWELLPSAGILFAEENGVLKLFGNPTENRNSAFLTNAYPRQDITVMIDFRAPTGIQADTFGMFRIQFDSLNYFEIGVNAEGYQLVRVINNQVWAFGNPLPLFGDETTNFHKLKLSYNDGSGHVDAYIDNIKLDGIADSIFSTSFANLQFVFYSFSVEGHYIEREWDNFTFSGEP